MTNRDAHNAADALQTDPQEWARELSARVNRAVQRFPEVDRDNVRHTLILLELPPLERLQRSLLRGGFHIKTARGGKET